MNNTQLFAVAIPFVILLGAIVAGAWLNQRGLERQMDAFRSEIKAEIGAFKSAIRLELVTEIAPLRADVEQVKKSVERIERQLHTDVEQMNKSVERVERQLHSDVEQVKKTVEKIDRQLEAIVSRLILPK